MSESTIPAEAENTLYARLTISLEKLTTRLRWWYLKPPSMQPSKYRRRLQGRYGMSRWLRNALWIAGAAAVIYGLSICNAWAGADSAQSPSDAPVVRSGQGQPCGSDADCASGLSCFQSGSPKYINFCTSAARPVYRAFTPGGSGSPAKTCKTASDCGPGDWTCTRIGLCVTTGGRRCSTNADCVGGWMCKWVGAGSLCFPP